MTDAGPYWGNSNLPQGPKTSGSVQQPEVTATPGLSPMFTAGYNSRQREVDELRAEIGAWVHRQAELQAQVALQERRFREAETEWVERYERLDAEVERLRTAARQLAGYTPGEGPEELFNTDNPMYVDGDETAPFFSETYLYTLVGKDIARSLLALIHACQT